MSPKNVMDLLDQRNYTQLTALDILYAIKFFGNKHERGFTPESYRRVVTEIKAYFPDIEELNSDRTEEDISTITYTEYGRRLDVLYSGTGLKHFLDVLIKAIVSKAQVLLIDEPELGLHPDLQRQFLAFLQRFSHDTNIQVFMATHSSVMLDHADSVTVFRVKNTKGRRDITKIPKDAIRTTLSDLGIRPSDLFNQDMCILVEGADDVIFFEHLVRTLYDDLFGKLAIGVQQYGGGAADGIISGSIDITNITPAQQYALWIRDRDARPTDRPSTHATQFKNALSRAQAFCHILERREIEFYYPEAVLREAQRSPEHKARIVSILNGDQAKKFRHCARDEGLCLPRGKRLRNLLSQHLTSINQLSDELRDLVEKTLRPWAIEICGGPEDTTPNAPAEPTVPA